MIDHILPRISTAGGAVAPPAGKLTSGHYDAYNRQHTTTDHHRCLLYHAAPQRLRLRPAALGSQFGGFVFALPCDFLGL